MNSSLGRMDVIPILHKSALFFDSVTSETSRYPEHLSNTRPRVLWESASGQQHRGLHSQSVGYGAALTLPLRAIHLSFSSRAEKGLRAQVTEGDGGPKYIPTFIKVGPCTDVYSDLDDALNF